jgi:hypothetical protein
MSAVLVSAWLTLLPMRLLGRRLLCEMQQSSVKTEAEAWLALANKSVTAA